jgi:hypothetical protein
MYLPMVNSIWFLNRINGCFLFLGTALDILGFGCVFDELTLRETLFRVECKIDQLILIFR